MIRQRIVLTVPFLVALLTCVVNAQIRVLTKEEHDALTDKAFSTTETRIRREVTENKTYENGKLTEVETITQDYLPPNKEKWLIVNRSGGKVTTTEIVYLGKFEYRRENAGRWKKIDRDDPKNQMTIMTTPSPNKAKEVITYSVEDTEVNGSRTRILFFKSNMAFAFSPGLQTRHITLDSDGYILKIEESVSEPNPDDVVYTSVQTNDYSVKGIRIEAPIR